MSIHTRLTLVLLAVALVVGVGACATGGASRTDEPPAVLEVDNQSTFLMNIYVVRDSGERRRLGQARSLGTTTFRIPSTLIFGITPLRFQADPVGSNRAPISDQINVVPGDTVVMTIPPHVDVRPASILR